MISNVNGSQQNVALEPAAPRPVDPTAEAGQRERQREAIEDEAIARRSRKSDPEPEHDERSRHVDRVA